MWIGLIGVVVGGVITTAWAWLAVVRQELSDAVVSARLVDESLAALQHTEPPVMPAGLDVVGVWEANRSPLARALGHRQWEAVSGVYQQPREMERAIAEARAALHPLVRGKRYLVLQRLGNVFDRAEREHAR